MKICHDDHKAYLVMIVIIMLITRVIVMMMMIDQAHLVAIVPVKTVDNAPANLETQMIKYQFILYQLLIFLAVT